MFKLNKLAVAFAILASTATQSIACSGSFDRYVRTDADQFLKEFDGDRTTAIFRSKGLDRVIRLEGKLIGPPFPASDPIISQVGTVLGQDMPPTNFALAIETKEGRLVRITLQDRLASSILDEIKRTRSKPVGAGIRIWAIHIYDTPERPGLLATCAETNIRLANQIETSTSITPQSNAASVAAKCELLKKENRSNEANFKKTYAESIQSHQRFERGLQLGEPIMITSFAEVAILSQEKHLSNLNATQKTITELVQAGGCGIETNTLKQSLLTVDEATGASFNIIETYKNTIALVKPAYDRLSEEAKRRSAR